MQTVKSCGYAMVLVLMSGLSAAWGQDTVQPPTLPDDLEFKTEIGWHELLIKRRSAEGAALEPFRSDGCSGGLSMGWALVSTTLRPCGQFFFQRLPMPLMGMRIARRGSRN